jgi:transposase
LPLYQTIVEHKYDEKSIAVFDRGLKSRKKIAEIDSNKKLFVIPIKFGNKP